MTDFTQTPRYQLPDEWEVGETMCVKITIPADQQYYGQLIGLLDTLKWSKNFAPDETRTGAATVSRTWQSALESEPIEIEGCDMPDFRINEDTCLLEVNCSDDPEAPDWQPVFTPAYDPTEDAPPVALYPDAPPEGETNQCLAAENVTAFFQHGIGQFAALLGIDGVFGQIATLLYTMLSGLVAMVQANLWFTLLEVDWGSFNNATIEGDYASFDWDTFRDLIVCYFSPNGEMNPANHLEALDDMESHAGQIWRAIRLVWSLAGSIGISLAAKWAGITDGDCAECEVCGEWEHTFDFTVSAHGFTPYPNPFCGGTPMSNYVGGQGFVSVPDPCGGGGDYNQGYLEIASTYITNMYVTWESENPEAVTGNFWIMSGGYGASGSPVNQTSTTVRWAIGIALGDYEVTVTSVKVCGNGENPFA